MLVQTQVHYDVVFFFLSFTQQRLCLSSRLPSGINVPARGQEIPRNRLEMCGVLEKKTEFCKFPIWSPPPRMFGLLMFRNNLKSYRISDTTMGAGSSSFCFGFVVSVIKFETKQIEKRSRNLMDCKQFLCATVVQDFRCGWRPKQLEVTNQVRSSRKGNQTLLRLILWLVCRRPTMQWATPGRLVRSQLGLFEQQIRVKWLLNFIGII